MTVQYPVLYSTRVIRVQYCTVPGTVDLYRRRTVFFVCLFVWRTVPAYSTGVRVRWVYVTGCDSGFGRIMVEKIRAMDGTGIFAGVYLSASVDELHALGDPSVVPVQVDVTDEGSVQNAAKFIREHLQNAVHNAESGAGAGTVPALYGVCNNAGILINPGPTEWTPLSTYKKMMAVNVFGMADVTRSVLPMIRKGKGRIVNTASIAGRAGLPSQPAYCASKYAVEGYSEVLRRDMLPWGVTVHIIEPGIFPNTGLYAKFQGGLDKLWEDLDDQTKEDYGEVFYKKFRERLGKALNLGSNTDSSKVPDAMLDALFSDAPKYRYRVGNDSKYLVTALNMMHESSQDALWMYPSLKSSDAHPAAAPEDGAAEAKARYRSDWSRTLLLAALGFMGYRAVSRL